MCGSGFNGALIGSKCEELVKKYIYLYKDMI